MTSKLFFFLSLALTMACSAQTIELAKNSKTNYHIYIPQNASATDAKAAAVLQDYFYRVTGAHILVNPEPEKTQPSPGLYIGATAMALHDKELNTLPADGFIIKTLQKNIIIAGRGTKGTIYGVYDFIEKYLGCNKWDEHPAVISIHPYLSIPAGLRKKELPTFRYREVYLPAAFNDEYLDWHRLQRFETLWGLWGHSVFKLVSPGIYFQSHPEYFSLVNGKRTPMQLCLSNASVLKITVESLMKRMADNPSALYWSVSTNDDNGNCECDNCKKLDDADGGPQGSLIHFINAVAAFFPAKKITTLAYGYTARATTKTRPASNVVIMLSSIDAYRTIPLATERTAAAFRNNLRQWKEKTANIFVWDYCTQFTNYLTPFPVTSTFKPNIDFFTQQGVSGVFEQGSADTYSDMPELKAWVLARLLWNPAVNTDSLVNHFLEGYYGKAAPVIASYLSLLQKKVLSNGIHLDIYGNPVNNHTDYLSPDNLATYSELMDKAEALAATDPVSLQHIQSLRITQEYVYLQQAKFFGKDLHGLFVKDEGGNFIIKNDLPKHVEKFMSIGNKSGVKEISEGGFTLSKYVAQWQEIFHTHAKNNLAANATVQIIYPFVPEYPSKKERTLVDETPGYEDFSYNWLCFYDVPMEATVDMGTAKKVNTVTLHFLEDARHWIFRPSSVSIQVSADGLVYRKLNIITNQMSEEDYTVNFMPFHFSVNENIRYIKVTAANWPSLPVWRYHKYKKPMIACDEIWVE